MSNNTNPLGIVSEGTFSEKFDELINVLSDATDAYQDKMKYHSPDVGEPLIIQNGEDITEDIKELLSPDLTNYAEKSFVESSIEELSTDVQQKLDGKANLGTSYTKAESDDVVSQLQGEIDTKANADYLTSNYYNKSEVYPISDVYSKEEMDDLCERLEGKIDSISELSMVVVETLPDDISQVVVEERVIYLIPSDTTEENSIYDEYLLINGNPERIGTTAIDLTNYVTFDHLNNNYYNKAYIDNLEFEVESLTIDDLDALLV